MVCYAVASMFCMFSHGIFACLQSSSKRCFSALWASLLVVVMIVVLPHNTSAVLSPYIKDVVPAFD